MMSPKNEHSNHLSKHPEKRRLPAAYRRAYVPLTARLRLPFTLSFQEARSAVFSPAQDSTTIGFKNARFSLQNARHPALREESNVQPD